MNQRPPRNWQDEGRRVLGLYVCGGMGKGKSSLIMNMALWDIAHSKGACIIDPSADLIKTLIHWIPPRRVRDTIYFNTKDPIPIDLFSYDNLDDRDELVNQLVTYFDLGTAPVSERNLEGLLVTLFEANDVLKKRGEKKLFTFLNIPDFITRPGFRENVLKIVPHKREAWTPWPTDWTTVLNRFGPFRHRPALQKIFAGGGLNIRDIIEKRKIFLVDLNNSKSDYFIGSLITAKFQQAIFARRNIAPHKRTPYFLYIDECNVVLRIAEQSFEDLLMQCRKYKLCLTMANVLPSKLPLGIQNTLGAVENYIVFRMNRHEDAKFFAEYLKDRPIDDRDISGNLILIPGFKSLRKFHALCIMDGQVEHMQTPAPLGTSPRSSAHLIYKNSKILQKRYLDNSTRQEETAMLSLKQDGNTSPRPQDETFLPDRPKGRRPPKPS